MLIEIIEKEIQNRLKKNERPDFYFSPSRSGTCAKALYYEYAGITLENNQDQFDHSKNSRVFWEGHSQEDSTVNLLNNGTDYVITSRQVHVDVLPPSGSSFKNTLTKCPVCGKDTPENALFGHIDGIYKITENGIPRTGLFEHKAVNADSFTSMLENGIPIGYLRQMALYMLGMKQSEGLLIAKNKNTSDYLEAKITYNNETDTLTLVDIRTLGGIYIAYNKQYPRITSEVFRKFEQVIEAVSSKKEPPKRDESIHNCILCPYRGLCMKRDRAQSTADMAELPSELRDEVHSAIRKYMFGKFLQSKAEAIAEQGKEELLSFFKLNKLTSFTAYGVKLFTREVSYVRRTYDEKKLEELLGDRFQECIKKEFPVSYVSLNVEPSKSEQLMNALFGQKHLQSQIHLLSSTIDTEEKETVVTSRQLNVPLSVKSSSVSRKQKQKLQ